MDPFPTPLKRSNYLCRVNNLLKLVEIHSIHVSKSILTAVFTEKGGAKRWVEFQGGIHYC